MVAERVARRVAQTRGGTPTKGPSPARSRNGGPVREEISAIRAGLHELENKLERIESKIVQGVSQSSEHTRARVIDFVASGPPLRSSPAIEPTPGAAEPAPLNDSESPAQFVPATQSPWLRDFNNVAEHASQERFGIEEATVTELVEFFESEKKCSVEPGGKPCDHCAMCSSRGF